jgi:hypothetical protein
LRKARHIKYALFLLLAGLGVVVVEALILGLAEIS